MRSHLGCLLMSVVCASAQAQTLRAVRISNDVPRPTDLASPPGDTARIFVVEGRRGVRIIKDGVLLGTPFLDISSELAANQAIGSIAFHPDYADNGRFFILYVDENLVSHVAEYHVSADPDLADPSTRVEFLGPFQQSTLVHLWNQLVFGPDGMLYIAVGDDIWTDDPLPNYSQDLSNLLGKILRLDVDLPPPYVPPDNPFVGQAGVREEIWAWGLRQPWRIAFDPVTSDLFIGEVGSNDHEELNFLSGSSPAGANLGWRCFEGNECLNRPECTGGCADPTMILPIHEYSHVDGLCCIIGGYVYRGQAMPSLHGTYFFADYCSGRIWSLRYDGQTMTEYRERTAELAPWNGAGTIGLVSSFGLDANGELYILDNSGGEVYKVVEAVCDVTGYCMTSSNSVGDGATLAASGTTSIAANDFTLAVSSGVPNQFGLFFYGGQPDQVPFGDGLMCVHSPLYRLEPPEHLNAQGSGDYLVDFFAPPQAEATIRAGSTWHFQFWYRDPVFGQSGFNTSDALAARFCP